MLLKGFKNEEPPRQQRPALFPHDWLSGLNLEQWDTWAPNVKEAACMLIIAQYFGWRASTTMSLRVEEIRASAAKRTVIFPTRLFKSHDKKAGLPCGELKLTALPLLFEKLVTWLIERRQAAGTGPLFPTEGQPAARVKQMCQTLSEHMGRQFEVDSHTIKRGTASILAACDMKPELQNIHMGWAYNSSTVQRYRRPCTVQAVDREFFRDVLALQ